MPRITSISWKRFEKFLLSLGCEFVRQEGDHLIYQRTGLIRPIVVRKVKDLPPFIILNNLRVLKIDREEYLKLIQKF